MANCERSRELAQAYLDGTLPPAERTAFENHLGACPSCRQVVATYRRLFAALAAPAIPAPSGDLTQRTLGRIRVAARRRRAAQTLVSAAAVALCGVVASLAWGLPQLGSLAISVEDLAIEVHGKEATADFLASATATARGRSRQPPWRWQSRVRLRLRKTDEGWRVCGAEYALPPLVERQW